jgi:hypothetical protein
LTFTKFARKPSLTFSYSLILAQALRLDENGCGVACERT